MAADAAAIEQQQNYSRFGALAQPIQGERHSYFQRTANSTGVEQLMTSSNLTLHCGAFKASRHDLISVNTPEATSTWVEHTH
jgi:hypothetical protein